MNAYVATVELVGTICLASEGLENLSLFFPRLVSSPSSELAACYINGEKESLWYNYYFSVESAGLGHRPNKKKKKSYKLDRPCNLTAQQQREAYTHGFFFFSQELYQ